MKGTIAMSIKKALVATTLTILLGVGLITIYQIANSHGTPISPIRLNSIPQAVALQTDTALDTPVGDRESNPTNLETEETNGAIAETKPVESGMEVEESSPVSKQADDKEKKPNEGPFESIIAGTVYDEWDAPVPGADVVVAFGAVVSYPGVLGKLGKRYRQMSNPENQYAVVTNEFGQYVVSGHFDETIGRVIAHSNSAKGSNTFNIEVTKVAESMTTVDVIIKGGISLVGQILSPEDRPIRAPISPIWPSFQKTAREEARWILQPLTNKASSNWSIPASVWL